MNKIIYEIARAETMSILIEEVNDGIQNGWKPLGGPFVFQEEGNASAERNAKSAMITYIGQALIKEF